jgi:branched-chain amino acid transport system substrate-binding protein
MSSHPDGNAGGSQSAAIPTHFQRQRRQLIRCTGAATLGGFWPWSAHRAWAQANGKKPLLIGLTTDDTGQYGASGQDERRGILMAIAEVNERGGVLGRRIETAHSDTAGDAVKAAAVAGDMLRGKEVGFLLGGVHSGAANAISKVAQKYGCIYFNTNSSSPTEAGKDCHRVKFVWDGNGTNFSTCGATTPPRASAALWRAMADASWRKCWCRRIPATFPRSSRKSGSSILV